MRLCHRKRPATPAVVCGLFSIAFAAAAQTAPYVHTQTAGPVSATNATLNGMVVPNGLPTMAWFEWGTNVNYGFTTTPVPVGMASSVLRFSEIIGYLPTGGVVFSRLVASNEVGVVYGAQQRFSTGKKVIVWGPNNYGELNVPPDFGDAVAIAGFRHHLALKANGVVLAWGQNNYGQTVVPPAATNVIAVACGDEHNLALRGDGTVTAWGRNDAGQTAVPPGLSNVVAIAGGNNHSLALRADGSVVAWGYGDYGQTNVPAGLSNVVAIAGGFLNSLALIADGTLQAWGDQAGTLVPPGLSNVVAIKSLLALKSDGTVTKLGSGTSPPVGLSNAVAITAYSALKEDGTIVSWSAYPPPAGMSNVVALESTIAIGPNQPPLVIAQNVSGVANHDLPLMLQGTDSNGDTLSFQITSLPASGSLFQFDSGSRGAPIPSSGTTVADPAGRVVFVPVTNTFGSPYATFDFIATDGQLDSVPATASVRILGEPQASTLSVAPAGQTAVTLRGMAAPNGFATVAWFEWGTNGSVGPTTPPQSVGDGPAMVYVSATITNLASVGSFHCRLVASNATGLVYGGKQLFTTRGKLVAWGRGVDSIALLPPPPLDRVVSVAAGRSHAVALNRDGTVVAFAMDYSGQSSILTNVPANVSNVVAVAAGEMHSLALKADGKVSAWGNNSYNQTSVPSNLTNAVAVAAGSTYSLALLSNGAIRVWGIASPNYGQATIPAGLSNVLAIATGGNHSLALRNDGKVIAWGDYTLGQTNVPPWLSNVVAVAGGDAHSLALRRDGTVVAWGDNSAGQTNVPVSLSNVVAIAGGDGRSLALRNDGTVVGWGLAPGRTVPTNLPAATAIAADSNFGLAVVPVLTVLPYSATQPATQITTSGARLNGVASPRDEPAMAWFEWGPHGGFDQTTPPLDMSAANSLVQVGAAVSSLIAHQAYQFRLVVSNAFGVAYGGLRFFSTGARIAAWGSTNLGQATVPRGLTNAIAVAGGLAHSLGVRLDGSVIGWGSNLYGVTNPPAGLSNVIAVAAGDNHSLALKADGRVVAWGNNSSGQTNVPANLTNAIAVRVGSLYSIALRADGRVAAWGNNSSGQTNVPAGLSDVVAIASGSSHNLALRSDGTVDAWGNSAFTNVPATVSNIVAVAAGNSHSLALNGAGMVLAWGNNTYGQTNVPGGLSNVVAIASGGDHALAMKSDGTIVGWGRSTSGQLAVPAGLTNVTLLAGGNAHSLAVADNAPPQALTRTYSGSANSDLVMLLAGSDANNDVITLRLATEPALGRLYQYSASSRGPAMTSGATVSDPAGRIIFAPGANGYGSPYTNFTYVANDGEMDSLPAKVTVSIFAPMTPTITSSTRTTNGAFQLTFQGHTRTTYCVWASTNLLNWEYLGFPTQPSSGDFLFLDADAANLPQRFYRISTGCGTPLPELSRISGLTNGAFHLRFTGGPYWTYRVWASTNLVNWEMIGTADEASAGAFEFLDRAASNFPQRFYKAGAP